MESLNIQCENAAVKYAVELFFDNYGKDAIPQFLNNVMRSESNGSDAYVEKGKDGTITVWQTAPDKGFVLAPELTEYKALPVDAKYVIFDGVKLTLFLKAEDGKPDTKIGHFLNINEVVSQWESDSVKTAIDTIKAGARNLLVDQKKAAKTERRAAKKGSKTTVVS